MDRDKLYLRIRPYKNTEIYLEADNVDIGNREITLITYDCEKEIHRDTIYENMVKVPEYAIDHTTELIKEYGTTHDYAWGNLFSRFLGRYLTYYVFHEIKRLAKIYGYENIVKGYTYKYKYRMEEIITEDNLTADYFEDIIEPIVYFLCGVTGETHIDFEHASYEIYR